MLRGGGLWQWAELRSGRVGATYAHVVNTTWPSANTLDLTRAAHLAKHKVVRAEHLAVGAGTHCVHGAGLQVHQHRARHVAPCGQGEASGRQVSTTRICCCKFVLHCTALDRGRKDLLQCSCRHSGRAAGSTRDRGASAKLDGSTSRLPANAQVPTAGGLIEVHIDALQLQVALAAVLQGRSGSRAHEQGRRSASGGGSLRRAPPSSCAILTTAAALTVPVGSTPCSSHTTCGAGHANRAVEWRSAAVCVWWAGAVAAAAQRCLLLLAHLPELGTDLVAAEGRRAGRGGCSGGDNLRGRPSSRLEGRPSSAGARPAAARPQGAPGAPPPRSDAPALATLHQGRNGGG